MIGLNQKKILGILLERKKGESSRMIAKIQHITRGRVDQIRKRYRDIEEIPVIGWNVGRLKKPAIDEESEINERTYHQSGFGARMPEVSNRIRYELSVSYNRILRYLMVRGLARAEDSKREQRRWVRYVRDPGMSAGHIDWHEDDYNGLKFCAVLDDSFRKILVAGEFATVKTENPIGIVNRVVRKFGSVCSLRELIMDHGSEFGAHRGDENGDSGKFYWRMNPVRVFTGSILLLLLHIRLNPVPEITRAFLRFVTGHVIS